MQTVPLNEALGQFTGTHDYYLHWTRKLTHTDGVQYLAENAGAHWLVDAIASYQTWPTLARDPELSRFQVWELRVNADRSADLLCRADTGRPDAIHQHIEFTDFPLDEVKFFVAAGGPQGTRVLMLPSEY